MAVHGDISYGHIYNARFMAQRLIVYTLLILDSVATGLSLDPPFFSLALPLSDIGYNTRGVMPPRRRDVDEDELSPNSKRKAAAKKGMSKLRASQSESDTDAVREADRLARGGARTRRRQENPAAAAAVQEADTMARGEARERLRQENPAAAAQIRVRSMN